MATPQFTKVVANGKHVALHWKNEDASQQLTCPAKPRPSFDAALQAFKPFLLRIFGAPASWDGGTTITGISVNREEDGRRGLVVTARRKCPHGSAPTTLNTPHLREPIEDKDTGTGFFLEGMADAIDTMCEEAEKYLNGDRTQGELFDEEDGEAGKPELVGA